MIKQGAGGRRFGSDIPVRTLVDGLTEKQAKLFDEAVRRFGTRCLWNARPPRTAEGLRVVAARLRAHAGMDAWRLAAEIRRELGDAPR